MAEVLPFIGTRFNSQLIGNLAKVLCPPYDLIDEDQQRELYALHENNVVRLERPVELDAAEDEKVGNRYTLAANTLGTWRSDGIVIEDDRPSYYIYEQEFQNSAGLQCKRKGFLAKIWLEDFKNWGVDPGHAQGSAERDDRIMMLRATEANISPIFATCDDTNHVVSNFLDEHSSDKPWEKVTDSKKNIHRLWVIQKRDNLVSLYEKVKPLKLFIADGGQRLEAALEYRKEMRKLTGLKDGKQPFDFVMMYIVPDHQCHLDAVASHRMISKSLASEIDMPAAMEDLAETFEIQKSKIALNDPEKAAATIMERIVAEPVGSAFFAIADSKGHVSFLKLKEGFDSADLIDDDNMSHSAKQLSVCVLHKYIISQVMLGNPEMEFEPDELRYEHNPVRALEMLAAKKMAMAFFLSPASDAQIQLAQESSERIPLKAAQFIPPPVTGLVFRNMKTEQKKTSKR